MPFSKSSFDQKLQTAWKNPPYWYQYLSAADKLVYNGLFPNKFEIVIPKIYPFVEEGNGIVAQNASNFGDIYDTILPSTGVAPGSFPDVIRTGILGGTVNITSTAAADTNTAGTGLRKVVVIGMAISSLAFTAEIINMNGIANVTTTNIYTALKVIPLEFGTNGVPSGVITANDGAKDIFQIAALHIPSSGWVFNPANATITMRTVITDVVFAGTAVDLDCKYKMVSPSTLSEYAPVINGTRLEFSLSKSVIIEGLGILFPMAKSTVSGNQIVTTRITGYRIQV